MLLSRKVVGDSTGRIVLQAGKATSVPGLFVLPSGTIPPNPSELLASDRMRELLVAAQRRAY